jgi:hypothetical protein
MNSQQAVRLNMAPAFHGFLWSNWEILCAWLLLAIPALASPPVIPTPQSADILCAHVKVKKGASKMPSAWGPKRSSPI